MAATGFTPLWRTSDQVAASGRARERGARLTSYPICVSYIYLHKYRIDITQRQRLNCKGFSRLCRPGWVPNHPQRYGLAAALLREILCCKRTGAVPVHRECVMNLHAVGLDTVGPVVLEPGPGDGRSVPGYEEALAHQAALARFDGGRPPMREDCWSTLGRGTRPQVGEPLEVKLKAW